MWFGLADDGENTNSSGGSDGDADTPANDEATEPDAATNAEENIDDLEETDNIRSCEVLDVRTGQPTSISDTVTGDRPVLLWFWAPH